MPSSLIGEEGQRGAGAGGADGGGGGVVVVRYFAGARAAAGVVEETVAAGLSIDDLAAEVAARRGERLAAVLKAASFLVDGVACHDHGEALPAGATVDVLPPFAGG